MAVKIVPSISIATPIELGYGWMFRRLERDDRAFVGRASIEQELAAGSSRFRLVGLDVDWHGYEHAHRSVGLPAAKDHVPIEWAMMLRGGSWSASTSWVTSRTNSDWLYMPPIAQALSPCPRRSGAITW